MYKVELSKTFKGASRNRAGLSVTRVEPLEVELSDDQLKALKADPAFTVTEVKSTTTKTTSRKMTDKQRSKKA